MKIILIFLVFCVVIHTIALPISSQDNGELNESNLRLRRAYNYERHSDQNYDAKTKFLILKISTIIGNLESTTVPMKTSTPNQNRAYKEDNFKSTTEQQLRTITEEKLRAFTEQQIRTTTEDNSSREQTTVENKLEI